MAVRAGLHLDLRRMDGQVFDAAYPAAAELRRLKRDVDPAGRFSNELWRRYL